MREVVLGSCRSEELLVSVGLLKHVVYYDVLRESASFFFKSSKSSPAA